MMVSETVKKCMIETEMVHVGVCDIYSNDEYEKN